MSTEQRAAETVLELDPANVKPDPNNARKELRGIPELAESFRRVGQLTPIRVRHSDEGWIIESGHRRVAAAAHAGVTVKAIEAESGENVTLALRALVDNDAREDLDDAERAEAYQAVLAMDGLAIEDVAAAVSRSTEEVTQLTAIGASPPALDALREHYDLRLEHAAALAEFADDDEARDNLLDEALTDPDYFEHALARHRAKRTERQELAQKIEVLRQSGVAIIDQEEQAKAFRLELLTDDKGAALTAKRHMRCPGNAAGIWDDHGSRSVRVYCTDPDGNGHKHRTATAPLGSRPTLADSRTEAQREKDSKERRETIANNKGLDVANGVRREYVKKLLARTTAPTGLAEYVAAEVLARPATLTLASGNGHLWADLTGKPLEADLGTPWTKSPAAAVLRGARNVNGYLMAIFGMICAGREGSIDKTAWRATSVGNAAYLTFLVSTGYRPSPEEQMIVDAVKPKPKKAAKKAASAIKKAPVKKAAKRTTAKR